MMRLSCLAALALVALCPVRGSADDVSKATDRLSAIDTGLTTCLTARMSAASILPGAMRDCIATVRPHDHSLRRDLNGWIPSLPVTDPGRVSALRTRQDLNALRAFMNALDKALLYRRAAMDRAEIARNVQAACQTARIAPADNSAAPPLLTASLCD